MKEIKCTILTGPTGAIGSALCRLLNENRILVYAIIRPGSHRADHLRTMDCVQLIECDISNLSTLPTLLQGVQADAFFHLAWAKTTGQGRNDMPAQIANIRYTIDACRVAKELGCQVFIGAGSQAEYGRVSSALKPDTPCFPVNGYGMAKLCAGQMSRAECEELGIDHIWPRILSVYGPYDGEAAMIPQVIKKLLAGERPSLTAGEQIWDYLYADDAAEALHRMALFGKNGAVYPLGSGTARFLKEYIEILRDAIDPSLPLGFGEVPYSPQQVMYLTADISDLTRDTGFVPKNDFQTGIRETIHQMSTQEIK